MCAVISLKAFHPRCETWLSSWVLICFPMLLIQELAHKSTNLCMVTNAFAALWRCASNGQTQLKRPSRAKARKAAQEALQPRLQWQVLPQCQEPVVLAQVAMGVARPYATNAIHRQKLRSCCNRNTVAFDSAFDRVSEQIAGAVCLSVFVRPCRRRTLAMHLPVQ